MIHKTLSEISEADLRALIDAKAPETLTLEFKLQLSGSDREVREFLADVSAFANRSGGDLVIGISEVLDEDGQKIAGSLEGVRGVDADETVLRLENQMRDSIVPRVVGLAIQSVSLHTGAIAFVVRVPRSWNGPHVVDHGGHWRFYIRNSRGKHPMSVDEVRTAFLQTATLGERIAEFRAARTEAVRGDADYTDIPTIIAHVIPLSAMEPASVLDLDRVVSVGVSLNSLDWAGESGAFAQSSRYCFEGIERCERRSDGYTFVFRNGIVEGVDRYSLGGYRPDLSQPHRSLSWRFAQRLNAGICRYLDGLRELAVEGPVAIAVTLLSVGGHPLQTPPRGNFEPGVGASHEKIDPRDLELPMRMLESPSDDPTPIIQDLIDIVWNAAGEPRSPVRLGP